MDVDFGDSEPDLAPQPNGVHPPARDLPHSLEAEEYLLSCCLLDGSDVVSRCLEAQIRVESFYDHKHGVVYEKLIDLYNRQTPIDIAVVAEELKASRQLDQIGGYAFLAQVSSRIPTTAQAGYFIEKVREQATLRSLIRTATGIVDSSYGHTGAIEDLLTTARRSLELVTEPSGTSLSSRRFNPSREPPKERVILSAAGVPISTAGNLTNIVALPGSGKSAVVGAIIAASFVSGTCDADLLGFSGPNYAHAALLHFDTEQSAVHYDRNLRRALRRSGVAEFPACFESYHLTGLSPNEARHAVESAVSKAARRGPIFAILIDGWADLVISPNDERECSPFVIRMHDLAIRHDTSIVGIMHLNPVTKTGDASKSRGHLGSYLDRKAETVLKLEVDSDGRTSAQTTKSRGAPLKAGAVTFRWSDEHQMHRICSTPPAAPKPAKRSASPTLTITALWSVIPGPSQSPVPHAALWRYAKNMGGATEAQFKDLMAEATADGKIERIADPVIGLTYRRQL